MTLTPGKAPLRIGLTGGIASGKSLVAAVFADLGVPVIDTDVIAREVVAPGQPALGEIRERFGEEVLDATGNLDRAVMRERIFAGEQARRDLEFLLHPRITEETRRQADIAGGVYQVIVVPLLVDSALAQWVDYVVVVDCDEDTQIKRLLARDAETVEQSRRILAAQTSREERLAIADYVIHNDQSAVDTCDQVRALHHIFTGLATHPSRRESSPETP